MTSLDLWEGSGQVPVLTTSMRQQILCHQVLLLQGAHIPPPGARPGLCAPAPPRKASGRMDRHRLFRTDILF